MTTAGKGRIETIMRCSKSYNDGFDRELNEKLVDDSSLHFRGKEITFQDIYQDKTSADIKIANLSQKIQLMCLKSAEKVLVT